MAYNRNLMDIDLEEQVTALRKELGSLSKQVARRGSNFYDEAGDTVSSYLADFSERMMPSLYGVRKRARAMERVAYDHPAVVAAVGLVVVGLVASLVISMRSSEAPPPARRANANRRPPSRAARTGRNSANASAHTE